MRSGEWPNQSCCSERADCAAMMELFDPESCGVTKQEASDDDRAAAPSCELCEAYLAEVQSRPAYDALCEIGFGPGFPLVDAFTLYSMVRSAKPARYLEVGSGLSTYYCQLARERLPFYRPIAVQPNTFSSLWLRRTSREESQDQ